MRIKVILRNSETGQYYAGQNRWVDDCVEAHDFCIVDNVAKMTRGQESRSLEVVMQHDDPPCDLVLPVSVDW
jgi:hypothetical protein